MAEAEGETSEALSVRAKAVQDLSILRGRIHDHEAKGREMRSEEKELVAFLKRLDRYEPTPGGPVDYDDVGDDNTPFLTNFLRRQMSIAAGESADTSPHLAQLKFYTKTGKVIERDSSTAKDPLILAAATAAGEKPAAPRAFTNVHDRFEPAERPIPRPTSRRGMINNKVAAYLEIVGPTPMKALIDALRSNALLFSFLGTRPEATLSSYLSRDPRFAFSRDDGGWTLIKTPADGDVDQDDEPTTSVDQEGGVG